MLPKIFTDGLAILKATIIKNNFPYWVVVGTQAPQCVYYFGPFETKANAKEMQDGYVEDLMEEKAVGIDVKIQRCLPTNLTIMEEEFLF